MTKIIKLILLRHGESVWNKENKFTGWIDVSLSENGKAEAKSAGKILRDKKYYFDLVFESVLKRSNETTDIVLQKLKLTDKIKRIQAWQLNERHYGSLQGLNKSEMAKKYGEEQVHKWRRRYSIRPPALTKNDKRYLEICKLKVPKNKLPLTESLKDTYSRVIPFFKSKILPEIKNKKRILISAHGNSLRSLVKYLDKISDNKITELNIPTGVPLVYELRVDKKNNCKVIRHYYLGNSETVKKAIESVKKQSIAKNN